MLHIRLCLSFYVLACTIKQIVIHKLESDYYLYSLCYILFTVGIH